MRISKQSAPYVDSYDLTVSRDELKLIHDALFMLIEVNRTELSQFVYCMICALDEEEHTENKGVYERWIKELSKYIENK